MCSPDVSVPGTRWWVEVRQSFRLHRCRALDTFAASLGICRNSLLSSQYDGLEASLSFLPFEQLLEPKKENPPHVGWFGKSVGKT